MLANQKANELLGMGEPLHVNKFILQEPQPRGKQFKHK